MAVYVSMKSDSMQRALRILGSEKDTRKAAALALNRAIEASRAEVLRRVPAEYTVKQNQVRKNVSMWKANADSLRASVEWRGEALNLADFAIRPGQPNPRKRPIVRAMITRSEGYKDFKGAFITKHRGRPMVFRRISDNDGRLPITGVWGPSIPSLIGGDSIKRQVEARANAQFLMRLDHEINRFLKV